MNILGIQAIPNQSFTTVLDSNRYDIGIFFTAGVMSVTIARNSVVLVENMRATAGTLLLPYKYQENGNFMFINLNEDLIDYTMFGTSQKLVYLSNQDIENLTAA